MSGVMKVYLGIYVLFVLTTQTSAELHRFKSWYPAYGPPLDNLVQTNCSTEYQNYIDNKQNITALDPVLGFWDHTLGAEDALVQCILNIAPELIKANMGSTQVLLGLMPTILSTLGIDMQEIAMLLVIGNNQFLAILLALGSPAVSINRSLRYQAQFDELNESSDWIPSSRLLRSKGMILLSYVLALAAIGNIVILSYGIGMRASFTFQSNIAWIPALWAFIGPVINCLGAFSLRSRISWTKIDGGKPSRNIMIRILIWLRRQFSYAKTGESTSIRLLPPSFTSLIISCFSILLAACYLIFGTLVFSAILFVGIEDALYIFLRYIGSVGCCRLIALHQLAMIRDSVNFEKDSKDVNSQENDNIELIRTSTSTAW